MQGDLVLLVVATAVVALGSPFLLRPVLTRIGVVDTPNHRSSHDRPTLRGGGVAALAAIVIGGGLWLAVAPWSLPGSAFLLVVLIATLVAGLLGLVEDVRGIPARLRALGQLGVGIGGAVAAVLVSGAPWWIVPVGALAIAAYINVANFMDGINGISGLHGLVAGAAFAVAGGLSSQPWLVAAGVAIAVAFVCFLPWNLLGPGMFLGDVGSYTLGAALSVAAVCGLASGLPIVTVIAPLALYLADTGYTLARRVLKGERWFEAHRSHVYQRLVDHGLSHLAVSALVALFSAAAAAFGLLAVQSPEWRGWAWPGLAAVVAAYFFVAHLVRRGIRQPGEKP